MFEFTEEQKTELVKCAPDGADWESFCFELQSIINEHPLGKVYRPTRLQVERMAAHFERFGKAVAAEPYAAVFVATRPGVDLDLDLEKCAALKAVARLIRLTAKSLEPNPLVDGYGVIEKQPTNAPGDANGTGLIRAIAHVVEERAAEAKGEQFVGLVRLCWQFSGRKPLTAAALYKRIGRALEATET